MKEPAMALPHFPGAGIWDPMNIAAYITWAAVACHPILHLTTGTRLAGFDGAPLPRLAPGLLAMALMLALFVMRARWDEQSLEPAGRRRANILGQAAAALVAFAALRDPLTPALLVVVAAQLGGGFPLRATLAWLAGLNLVLAGLVLQTSSGADAITTLVAYAGFQAFAAIGASFGLKQYEGHLAAVRTNAELRATRELLEQSARTEERLHLSRELHDVAGHKLTALKMQLRMQARQSDADPTAVIGQCERLADELLNDIRGVVSTLREHEGLDLQSALRALAPGLPNPSVRFELDAGVRIAGSLEAEALLHCAQEGLTNAFRHSGAAAVRVGLTQSPGGVALTVEDDGRGRSANLKLGNGLRGLAERLREIGGRLELQDRSPSGLTLRATLPAPGAERATPVEPPPAATTPSLDLHAAHRAGG